MGNVQAHRNAACRTACVFCCALGQRCWGWERAGVVVGGAGSPVQRPPHFEMHKSCPDFMIRTRTVVGCRALLRVMQNTANGGSAGHSAPRNHLFSLLRALVQHGPPNTHRHPLPHQSHVLVLQRFPAGVPIFETEKHQHYLFLATP